MKLYRFPEKKAWKLLFGLLLFALLVLNRDGMYCMAVWGVYPCVLVSYGLIGITGVVFLAVNRKQLKDILTDKRILAAVLCTVVMLLPMLIKRDWQLMYFNILMGLYVAIFFSFFVTVNELARYYVVILTALGACSLAALYLLRPLTDLGVLSPEVVYNSIDVEIYNYFISFVPISFVKNRNFGIFREPGVYQYFILLGIYLNNNHVDWDKSWKLWTSNIILAATMVSTFATGGVIELGLLIVVMFFDKQWYKDQKARLIAGVLVLAALALVGYCIVTKNGLYWSLHEMITKFVNNPESVGARVGSIGANLEYFLKNPLFGESLSNVLHLVGANTVTTDNTSSTMILYAVFGVLGGTLSVVAWFMLVWNRNRRIWANLALLVILFMSFNTQNLICNIFFWLFPVMALTERGVPMLNKKKG